jgi:hypothetical protein
VGRGSSERLVYGDAARSGFDPRGLQPELLHVGSLPRRDEDLVRDDLGGLAVPSLVTHRLRCARRPDARRLAPGDEPDPFGGEEPAHPGGDLGVLARQDLVRHFEDRHLRAEPLKDLAQLEADRAGAEDDE